jgi:tetratricopeptide (TPR) repeat protein
MSGVMRAAVAVLALALFSRATPAAPPPSPTPTFDAATFEILGRYLLDPEQNRRAVLRLAARGIDGLPIPVLMTLADIQLRTGRSGQARRLFEAVLAQNPDRPTSGWAQMGLGWAALARGDLETARAFYAQAPEQGGPKVLAGLMTGLIDAAIGDPASVAARLEALAADPSTPAQMLPTIDLMAGYARYWSGDLAGAAAAFAGVAAANPAGPAADDARFAGARVRAALGDREGAAEALQAMSAAKRPGPAAPRFGRGGLVDLDPRAMLRAAVRHYRHAGAGKNIDPVYLLDGDGHVLARAALRREARRTAREVATSGERGARPVPAAPAAPPSVSSAPAAPAATAVRGAAGQGDPLRLWIVGALALIALLIAVSLWRRQPAARRS